MEHRRSLATAVRAPQEASRHEQRNRLRLMLVGLAVSLWGLVIGARLVQLQLIDHAFFERHAARQSERTFNLDARRGSIYDRNGRPLAVSVDAESIFAVPQDVERPQRTASVLARALDLDASERKELLQSLQKNRGFVWIKRKVDPARAAAVRAEQLDGIGTVTETRRYYPKRELASQVLGYVGLDNAGMSGIEYSLDEVIRGRAAKVVVQTDARRRPLSHVEKPSTDGDAVVLTLDEAIQYAAERELERAMAETSSIAGVVVVMNPHSGEVLALANRPTFNPNRFGAYSSASWRNRAVADAYEPGSIFKVITAAAALQEKVVAPDEVIDCGHGSIEIAGVRINDHRVFDQLTFRDVIARSSDIGTIRVAQRLGRENFERYARLFGFGSATGIDLPGESGGLLKPISRWGSLSLASMSFGQEIGVTAIQMTSALAALANGGSLLKPRVVRRVEDLSGRVLRETEPVLIREVLDPQTISTVTSLMERVVTDGTGKKAAVPGYAVAGKTGTAQKIDPSTGRYSTVDHVASFVGFVPVSRPALVILVSLDSPRGALNHGGDVAAPVFTRVAEAALRRLAIPPTDVERRLRVPASPTLAQVAYRGGGDAVALPAPVEPADAALMPDLRGLPARDAALVAARHGLIVRLHGTGRVVEQKPEAGAEIESGATCLLKLTPDGPAAEGRATEGAAAKGGVS